MLAGALLAFGGCASQTRVLKTVDLKDHQGVATDAKLRLVTNLEVGGQTFAGRIEPRRVVCAEPSPDVAQAISDSFSAAISAAVERGAARGEGSLQIAHALAESVTQLGKRLGTIQLLRDKFYRACEAYANGAISATSYTLMLSRLDKTMTTMMLGEMAAGGLVGTTAAAGGSASAATQPKAEDIEKAVKAVNEQRAEVASKREARDKAKGSLDQAKEASDRDPQNQEKRKALEKAQVDSDAAQRKLTEAQQLENEARRELLERVTTAMAQSSGIGAGGASSPPADAVVTVFKTLQQQYFDIDDFTSILDACITSMDLVRNPTREQQAALKAQIEAVTQQRRGLETLRRLPETDVSRQGAIEVQSQRIRDAEAAAAETAREIGLSPFGYACQTQVLSRLQEILDKDRSTERFKAGLEKDKARMDLLKAQVDLCKAAVNSADTEMKKAGVKCIEELTTKDIFDKATDGLGKKTTPLRGGG